HGQVHEGADQPLAVPAVLQVGRQTAYLRAHDRDAMVVKLRAQEQAARAALVEAERDYARVVRAGADRLVKRSTGAGRLDAHVGAATAGEILDVFGRVAF